MSNIHPAAMGLTYAGMAAVAGTATALGVHLAKDDAGTAPVRVASGLVATAAAAAAGVMALSGILELGRATPTMGIAKLVGTGAGLVIAGAGALAVDS